MEDSHDSKRIDIVEANHTRLERHIGGLELEVGIIGKAVSGVETTLVSFGESLKSIAEKQNMPPERTNWFGLIGAIAALIVPLIVLLAIYITLSIEPVEATNLRQKERLLTLTSLIVRHDNRQDNMSTDLATVKSDLSHNIEIRKDAIHTQKSVLERLSAIERDISADEVHIQNLQDYIRMVDEKGSRKWITNKEELYNRGN